MPPISPSCRRLSELAIGQSAYVQRVEGDDAIALRLMEMGLTPGCEICLLGRAPLGDPLEIRLLGYHLSLRATEANRVRVSDLPPKDIS